MPYETKLLEGVPHLVVPVTMMTEGVWHGSAGPLMYPAGDLAAVAPAFNGVPVVVHHPQLNSSAKDPRIFNSQKVGVVFGAGFDRANRALHGQAWLNMSRLKSLSPDIHDAILRNEMVEVSTGVYLNQTGGPGTYKGKRFTAVAQHRGVDHLALLPPGHTGACSIAEGGAGLCRAPGQRMRVSNVPSPFLRAPYEPPAIPRKQAVFC